MPPTDPSALARRQLEAYNRHDPDAFAACYSEDVVLRRFPSGETILQGREALRRHYADLFAREPALRVDLLARVPCGAFVLDHEKVLVRPGAAPKYTVAIYEAGEGLLRRAWFLPVTEEPPPA